MDANVVDAGFHIDGICRSDPGCRRRTGLTEKSERRAPVTRRISIEPAENTVKHVRRIRPVADFAAAECRQQRTIDQVGR